MALRVPWLLIFLVLFIFLLWLFLGGKDLSEFKPLESEQRDQYMGSFYQRGSHTEPEGREDATPAVQSAPVQRAAVGRRGTSSVPEEICRRTLEQWYGVPFPCIRPSFLRNPETGACLELDCYNERLGLAVEYNGIQHYRWPNFTGQSYEAFIQQVRRDGLKVELCDSHGIYLITVPYTVKHADIPNYIRSLLPDYLLPSALSSQA